MLFHDGVTIIVLLVKGMKLDSELEMLPLDMYACMHMQTVYSFEMF